MAKGLEIFNEILEKQVEGTKVIISRVCKPNGNTDYALKQRDLLYHKMWGVVICLHTQNLLTDAESNDCMALINKVSKNC